MKTNFKMVASNTLTKSRSLYIDPASLISNENSLALMSSPPTVMSSNINNNNNNIITLNNTNTNKDVTTNNISEFYTGSNIFITGGTGFVGKALLEKLLRTCDTAEKIFVLIRPKRGLGIEQRLKELLKNPVFDKVREKTPEYFEKLKALSGDVGQPNLGLCEADKQLLVNQVNIVFHSAATVRFTEDLKDAVLLNTLGTKRVAELCKDMKHLKSFVHVSTAYSNADKKDVEEIVYDPPHDPRSIINCIETLPPDAVKLITQKLIGKHPNSYTLTKALAECLVSEYSGVLPAAIVRPSIITASWREPFPGWVDNISGITGIMMECARGSIKSIVCKKELLMDLIPVDIVVNTLITAAWHTATCRSNTIRVYNCTSSQINGISWKYFGELTQQYALEYPSKYVSWYPGFTYRTNRFMHWICHALLHYMPACMLDIFLYCTKHKPIMLRICRKIARAAKNGEFFALHEWNFHTTTISSLLKAVRNAEDGENFNIDLSKENGFHWDPYVKSYLLGIRQHILKDDLSTLSRAKTKLNRYALYWANKAVQVLSMYALLRLALW